jgi:hypothetical protein
MIWPIAKKEILENIVSYRFYRKRQQQMLQTTFSDVAMIMRSTTNRSDLQAKVAGDAAFRERYAQYQKAWDEMARDVNIEQQKISGAIRESFANQSHHQEVFATVLASLSPLSNFVFAATDAADVGLQSDEEWDSQAGRYSRSLDEYADRRYNEEKQKNPTFSYDDYLDLRARPRFQFQPPPVSTRLERILIPFGVLVIFNLLFFADAYVSFLRYDVR